MRFKSKPILVMNGADDRVKEDDPSNRMALGLTNANEIIIVGAVRSGWTALSLREMVSLLLIPESARKKNCGGTGSGTLASIEIRLGRSTNIRLSV